MSEWLASISPAVGDHLWQSTVFAMVAAFLILLLKKNHARLRYWIWLAALMKFLVPFSLLIGLGASLPRPQYAPMATPTAYVAMNTMSGPFEAEALPVPPIQIAGSMQRRIPEAMASIWICGVVVVLAMWWIRWRRVSAVVREATRADAGREVGMLRQLERDAGMRPVQLLLSRSSMEPGMFGIIRPVLLWPEGISARLSDGQIEAILEHELCHVRRRDNLFGMAQMVVETMFWFYPVVWWMGTRMVEERERACDEEVLGHGRNAEIYAESILRICEFCLESPLACVSGITGADLKRRIAQIMSRHFGRKLTRGKKAILAAAGLIAVAGPVAFGVVRMVPLHVQVLHATGPLPSYEVATIKPEVGPHVPGSLPKDIKRFTGTTKDLIEGAYNIPYGAGDRVVGGASWISSDRYIIEGKVPDDLMARMQKETDNRTQNSLMKQSLLADRFKLKVHFEMRELPVYALVVAKGGSRMKVADPNASLTPLYFPSSGGVKPADPSAPPAFAYANTFGPNHRLIVTADGNGALMMSTMGVAMDNVAQSLEEVVDDLGGRTIVNRTGLDGQYDFTLKWAPQQTAGAPGVESTVVESDAPSIFTALEEQLGLKLVSAKGMVEVVVIDSIERPSAN